MCVSIFGNLQFSFFFIHGLPIFPLRVVILQLFESTRANATYATSSLIANFLLATECASFEENNYR